jgi:hypothetical protein
MIPGHRGNSWGIAKNRIRISKAWFREMNSASAQDPTSSISLEPPSGFRVSTPYRDAGSLAENEFNLRIGKRPDAVRLTLFVRDFFFSFAPVPRGQERDALATFDMASPGAIGL